MCSLCKHTPAVPRCQSLRASGAAVLSALVWVRGMADFHRLTGIAIPHHPRPAHCQGGVCHHLWRDYPVCCWAAEQQQGSGSPAPGDHFWTSFSNGTWPSQPPEAPFPVSIPLNLPGAMTNGKVLWIVLQPVRSCTTSRIKQSPFRKSGVRLSKA